MSRPDDPIAAFGLSCPSSSSNGTFYICTDTTTRFLGCCGTDPCTADADGVCPDDQLSASSFDSASIAEIEVQSCVSPYGSGNWYTCSNASPPFIGCCRTNPCNDGCGEADLIEARLSDVKANAEQFLGTGDSSTSTSTSSGVSSTTQTATGTGITSPAATTTDAGGDEHGTHDEKSKTGLIVGISMAGVVVLLLVLGMYLWSKKRGKKRRERDDEPPGGETLVMGTALHHVSKETPIHTPQTTISSPPSDQGRFSQYPVHANQLPPLAAGPTTPGTRNDHHMSHLSELGGDDMNYMRDGPVTMARYGSYVQVSELEGSEISNQPRPSLSNVSRAHNNF
ncbi:hypothetical protein F5Y15DRAFT_248914 [Xylariaceae sp. FL0016]|nr:hypothetical protein F5Y15DRAFT_248914 [Xylariaceae sp. FL0016]